MAFPQVLTPNAPLDSDPASVLGSSDRATKQFLADVFGLPVYPNQVSAAATAIAASGALTIVQPGALVAADPTAPLGIATKQYVDNSTVSIGGYAVATGSANAIAITLSPAPSSLAALQGRPIVVKIATTNTGATTINPNGLGATAALANGAAMVGGELIAGQVYAFVYDGTNFLLFSVDGLWAPTVAPAIRVLTNADIAGSGFTVPSGSAGTVATVTLTMPSGGPWRAHVQYDVFLHSTGSQALEVWVFDGTLNFASRALPGIAIGSTSGNSNLGASEVSLRSYTGGTNVTFTLKAQASGSGITIDGASSIAAISSHWLIGVMAAA